MSKNWHNNENEDLAGTCLAMCENPILGADETRKVFMKSMFKNSISFSPRDKDTTERIISRTMISVTSRFSEISFDVQKFRLNLIKVHACDLIGIIAASVILISIQCNLC